MKTPAALHSNKAAHTSASLSELSAAKRKTALHHIPGTKIKHEEGWQSAACKKDRCVNCFSLGCACGCHKRFAKDGALKTASLAALLLALLAWYTSERKPANYDLTNYRPAPRRF